MGKLHTIRVNEQEHVLNFNSYAVMQAYKKYGAEGIDTALMEDPFTFLMDMLQWGLSDNGRKQWKEAELCDVIDQSGGLPFLTGQVADWIKEAFIIPVDSKKNETEEVK
jgi:hypothetical protein